MATTDDSDDVQWFGWELHFQDGHSDKFYRFMVALAPAPAAVAIYGGRGSSGTIGLIETGTDAQAVIRKVIDRTRNKENKGYTLTRGFTTFTAPADCSRTASSLRANVHTLSAHFGLAAVEQGTEEGNPASIPTHSL